MQRVAIVVGVLWIASACGDGGGGDPDAAAADAANDAAALDARIPVWSAPQTLSEPANSSFVPAIAARAGVIVVAWHDFPAGGGASRVVTRAITGDSLGPIEPIAETFTGPKRPTLAVTTTGFVLAWDAVDAGVSVIRTIDLDAAGQAIGTPVSVSAPGVSGLVPRIAADGDDVAFAWTDGTQHFFARRGPAETVAAMPVGTGTLLAGGILNFPRIAITSDGVLLVGYCDGGPGSEDLEVLLVIRQIGGTFLGPLNISRSPGLRSDDLTLAIAPDDTLDFVWVDQDPVDVNDFEVDFATRTPAGTISVPGRFGTQGQQAWTPSAVSGLTAAWHTGGGAGGELWLAEAAGPPQAIPTGGELGAAVGLARADGALHVVYVTPAPPRQIRHVVRR